MLRFLFLYFLLVLPPIANTCCWGVSLPLASLGGGDGGGPVALDEAERSRDGGGGEGAGGGGGDDGRGGGGGDGDGGDGGPELESADISSGSSGLYSTFSVNFGSSGCCGSACSPPSLVIPAGSGSFGISSLDLYSFFNRIAVSALGKKYLYGPINLTDLGSISLCS